MIPAQRIQQWAVQLAPSDLGACVLIGGVLIGLVCGLIRARKALLPALPTLAYVVIATCAVCYETGAPAWLAGRSGFWRP